MLGLIAAYWGDFCSPLIRSSTCRVGSIPRWFAIAITLKARGLGGNTYSSVMEHSYGCIIDLQRVRNSASRDRSRALGVLLELFQQAGPAAVDVLAHLLARFGAHLLEFAM